MSESEIYTAQQAADPGTPGQVLADIAALRPDLRPAVAANPSTYPGLLEWLGGLGEPSVDAALRRRAAAGQPVTASGAGPSGGGSTVPYGAGSGDVVGQQPSPYGAAPTAPYGGASASPFGAPATPYAAPGGPGYAGQPAASGYAGTPVQPYGYQQAGPPAKKSNKVLWIVLGVLAFFIALAVVAVIVIRGLVADAFPDGDLGSDPELDALVTQCENGDWAACDDLYQRAPLGSEYEDFGDTCGNRTDGGTLCVEEFGEATGGGAYGEDAELDLLWDACAAGDGQACDDLYNDAPIGSEYEQFGDTCGGTSDGTAWCATDAEPSDAATYGDDPALDALWDACAAGDGQACDDLYNEAPIGSEYEEFGNTCAGTKDGTEWCAP